MVYYGLLLFFIFEYVRPGSYFPALNTLHLNSVIPLIVLLGSLFTTKVQISEALGSPNARWIIFLLSLIVISGLTCDVQAYALDKFFAILGYFFMFVILKKEVYDFDKFKGVFGTLILVHLVVGFLSPGLFSNDGQRHYISAGSFLGDGNDFALSVNIVIPCCLYLLLESQSKSGKLFYLGSLVVLILAVVATQSRGAIIGLSCTGLYYWMKSDRKIVGAIGIVLVCVLILSVAPQQFFDRMESMTKTGDEMEGSAQGRIFAWKASIRMAMDHPILGVGVGHFPVKYGAEYRPEGVSYLPWQTAHSSYFLLLGELGIPGSIFIIGIIVSNLIAGERMLAETKSYRTERGASSHRLLTALNASMIAFAVGGAFLSAAYYPHIYLLAGLLECGRGLAKQTVRSEAVALGAGKDEQFL
jgi:probable O-glycosylation ligase (exosortase A-associated)